MVVLAILKWTLLHRPPRVPLKARAYLDLVARQQSGTHVDSRQIKKHRTDVFILYRTLAPADRFVLPSQLGDDLATFLENLPPDSQEWENIQAAVKGLPEPERVIAQIQDNFGIGRPPRAAG